MTAADGPAELVWFRQDLRVADNPALNAATASGKPVACVYVLDEETPGIRPLGGAQRWWLHGSLEALAHDLAKLGATLILRRGPAEAEILKLVTETGADAVRWNRCYEPGAVTRDEGIKKTLKARGVVATSDNAGLLFEPWTIETKAGGPFQVFTPFWRAARALPGPGAPLKAPKAIRPGPEVASDTLADWALLPTKPDWAAGMRREWTPGSVGAADRLDDFLSDAFRHYASERDRPDRTGTSMLSPHLHWGDIGPRQVWQAIQMRADAEPGHDTAAEVYAKELGWREFAHHLLFHFPRLPEQALRHEFNNFPWVEDAAALERWQRGQTGYPIVDAGMRQLWTTGWMHNRVRMIVASFLVKDLRIDWRQGEAWFWDTLVDADLANNVSGWQWVAGCGADAAPYFRVFNPVLQGEKFDPRGDYVRDWVPELADVPTASIHKPWTCSAKTVYPAPMIDHGAARDAALAAYRSIQKGAA